MAFLFHRSHGQDLHGFLFFFVLECEEKRGNGDIGENAGILHLLHRGGIWFPRILQERRWDLTIPDVSVSFNGNSKRRDENEKEIVRCFAGDTGF
jgi:hypothetical protein